MRDRNYYIGLVGVALVTPIVDYLGFASPLRCCASGFIIGVIYAAGYAIGRSRE